MVALLIFASIATGILSLIALFKPWPRLWLTSPDRAAQVLLASCAVFGLTLWLAPEPSPVEQAPASHSTFIQRLNAGAGCAELFGLRNAIDPGSSAQVRINEDLRRIGCYSAGSTRNP